MNTFNVDILDYEADLNYQIFVIGFCVESKQRRWLPELSEFCSTDST